VKNQSFKSFLSFLFLSLIIIMLGVMAACAPAPEAAPSSPTQFTDQLGRVVTVENPPQRIISLAPSNTEILFALGLGDRVVGVTDYCNYPPEATEKPSIGSYRTPNIEEIVALTPDLILATYIHEDKTISQFEDTGLTVIALDPKLTDSVMEAIALVGRITGAEADSAELVAEMQQRLKAVTDKTGNLPAAERPRTLYVVWHDPLMAAGDNTLQDELILKAGGSNIATELDGYADISLETVLAANPQVIIIGVGHGSGEGATLQYIQTESRLEDTAARVNDRIYTVEADLVSRPGPRIIDALEEFARFIHPELFE